MEKIIRLLKYYWPLSLIFLFTFLLRLPYFSQPPDYDESSMIFYGFYSRGDSFYFPIESFPTSGRLPGMTMIYRFADNIFPQNFAFIRLLSTLFIFIGIIGIFQIGKRVKNKEVGFLSAFVFAAFTSQISTKSPANAEFFMMPLVVISYLFLLKYLEKFKTRWLVISGFIGGLSILFKQIAIFEFGGLGLLLLFSIVKRYKKLKSKTQSTKKQFLSNVVFPILLFIILFLLPLLLTILIFYLDGQLNDLMIHGFGAASSYVNSGWIGIGWLSRIKHFLIFFPKKFWFFLLLGFFGIISLVRNKEKLVKFILIWFLFALLESTISGYFFEHYFVSIIPILSIFAGYFLFLSITLFKSKLIKLFFIFFVACLMVLNSYFAFFSYLKWNFGIIDKYQHWQNLGQDLGPAGFIPFIESANYLKNQMTKNDTFFSWSSNPITYYLIDKRPVIDFFHYYSVLDYKFMLFTYKGFKFDFEENRKNLMKNLTQYFPTYILFFVTPEQVFDQLFIFKDFSNFISKNYKFEKQFGNILVFKLNPNEARTEFNEGIYIPIEIIKRYSAITAFEKTKNGTFIIFEPMVNPNGTLRFLKSNYPYPNEVEFIPLIIQTLEIGDKDFVKKGVDKPSGSPYLHIKVKGSPDQVNFIRIKINDYTWNNQSYGVNAILKFFQKDDIFDLYVKPPKIEEGQILEVYFIYKNGDLGIVRSRLKLK